MRQNRFKSVAGLVGSLGTKQNDKSEFEAEVCIMNIGFWSCIILVIPFLIIGVLFTIFKEKAAKFVSGFNSFSKEEQALYDKVQISRDIRNQL